MADYKASLSRSQGREAWAVIFRHPMRRDVRGKIGLRIRKGLGTSDEVEATKLVEQLNTILRDETYWTSLARDRAELLFDSRVVSAFYNKLEEVPSDLKKIREGFLPFPSVEDGYSRTLLVGTTGAGKTTLLRQIMGTHSKEDRFPSTASGRTTICDIEVICAEEMAYSAVVTFIPRLEARFYIEECVQAAVQSRLFMERDDQFVDSLLIHREQKFRLNYVLGHPSSLRQMASSNEYDEWDEEEQEDNFSDEAIENSLKETLLDALNGYLLEISELSKLAKETVTAQLSIDEKMLEGEDRDALNELVLEYLDISSAFHDVIDDILDDVQSRFHQLTIGNLQTDPHGWGISWTIELDKKSEFLREIRRFSSNHVDQWGTLLTPLVDAIRVKGPFKPKDLDEVPRLVIIDGEGLGHVADTAVNLPTRITGLFDTVDSIILVDNGKQPMLAAPQSVLKTILNSGYMKKLIVAFTHLDGVNGDNMPRGIDKVNHVKASIGPIISKVQEDSGFVSAGHVERILNERSFFFWDLPKDLNKISKRQLSGMIDEVIYSSDQPPLPHAKARYESISLIVAIQNAAKEFHERWDSRLGIRYKPGITTEHWTRIKALNKRLAFTGQDYYDTLMPISDLIQLLSHSVSGFLRNPVEWVIEAKSDEEKEDVINLFRQEIFSTLHEFTRSLLWINHRSEWSGMFDLKGTGSGRKRSEKISRFFNERVSVVGNISAKNQEEVQFIKDVYNLVSQAIEEQGSFISKY
ncbi:hypothetical protein [Paenibacillus sp. SAF-068]|uniref:hypothetical protein n=1 Tax=Paenibacillus sp. SAF-068 TaxID=3436864 RepID=UPI003F7D23F4